MRIKEKRDLKILRILLIASAVVSISCTVMLILPSTFAVYFRFLNNLSLYLNLGGTLLSIPNDMVHVLFINTVGIDMTLIATFIIYAAGDIPYRKPIILFYILTRFTLAAITIYYSITFQIAEILKRFVIVDVILAMLLAYYYLKIALNPLTQSSTYTNIACSSKELAIEPVKNLKGPYARFKKLLIFSGWFNIICASPLALPNTFSDYLRLLDKICMFLNLGGLQITIPLDKNHSFFINVAGIHLVLTGVIIRFTAKAPLNNYLLAILNAVGRTLFFLIIIYLTTYYNISKILLIFGVLDFFISIGFILSMFQLKDELRRHKRRV